MNKNGKKRVKKVLYSCLGVLIFAAVMLVLTHPAQNSVATTELLPTINPDPVYVECTDGETVTVMLTARQDFAVSAFRLLLVNVSEESQGTLRIRICDDEGQELADAGTALNTITPGEWVDFPVSASFEEGREYELSIRADGGEPYFMQVPEGWEEDLPFTEKVWQRGEELSCGISLGILKIEPVAVTYGDIFYYSIPICVIILAVYLLFIWLGTDKVLASVRRIPLKKWIHAYGNDVFLVLLFVVLCVTIYSRSYLNGIYISADSTGYLEEAVSLVNGNGFQYDGLAGYRSWFANWPVLYPVLIAGMMLITKANAYLASRFVAMFIVGVLLLIFRCCFKKDAWLYGLCLTNIGFLNLCCYAWSEVPFILFLLLFGLVLARILQEEEPSPGRYVLLGISGICSFLTRYFGVYVWIVTGFYIVVLFVAYYQKKERGYLKKAIGLTITSAISGMACVGYLFMNKLMNGMASGVSRTMWWDDFRTLTDDLIESLLTEFFNVFSMQMPEYLAGFPYEIKVFVVLLILGGLVWCVVKNCRHFSRESVLIVMAVFYYGIFIAVRYVSSMDTFYFRFFEPGTFLFCVGFVGLLLPYLRGKRVFSFGAGAVTLLLLLSVWSMYENGELTGSSIYYEAMTAQWEQAYREIPEKSVVIFNDIDYRSSWYRPDVVDGTITPEDTPERLRDTYYGSDYLCIRKSFAEEMLSEGDYGPGVREMLQKGLTDAPEDAEFVVIRLGEA